MVLTQMGMKENIVGVVQHTLFLRAGCSAALALRRPNASRGARTSAVATSAPAPRCAGACLGRLVYDCHNIKNIVIPAVAGMTGG